MNTFAHMAKGLVSVIKNLVIEGYDFPGSPNDAHVGTYEKDARESKAEKVK